jgi:Right handed beta helix region
MAQTPRRPAFRPQGESLESRSLMAVIPVTTISPYGIGSLNWAINTANHSPGADNIVFQIPIRTPNPPFYEILLAPHNGYPAITGKVTINGYTQPLSQPNTSMNPFFNNAQLGIFLIQASPNVPVLTVDRGGSGSQIRGIAFASVAQRQYNPPSGLLINRANNVQVDGDGFTSIEQSALTPAIKIVDGSQNAIGGNTVLNPALQNVMHSYDVGIELTAGSQNNAIFGNYVGGLTSDKGPLRVGMWFQPGANNNTIEQNVLVKNVTQIFNLGTGNLFQDNGFVPR